MGCVYFIQADKQDTFKIGMTNGNASKRMVSMQTGYPGVLSVFGFISTANPEKLETEIHARLKDRRRRGEWFSIDPQSVEKIIMEYNGEIGPAFVEMIHNGHRYYYCIATGNLYAWLRLAEMLAGNVGVGIMMAAPDRLVYVDGIVAAEYDHVVALCPEQWRHHFVDHKRRLLAHAMKFYSRNK